MKTLVVQHGSAAGMRLGLMTLLAVGSAAVLAYGLDWFVGVAQRWAMLTAALSTCLNN